MTSPAISAEGVTVRFRPYLDKNPTLRRTLKRKQRRTIEPVTALDNVGFEVEKGEAFGVVGHNGAGKSTLVRVLAKTLRPDAGTVLLRGRATLLQLGLGFNNELSGRRNIYLGGLAAGLSKSQVDDRVDWIIDYSELGPAIDRPVKTYSSGMFSRLAFSVSMALDPDILYLDEVLGVGDEAFREKSMTSMRRLLEQSGTIVFVSHSLQSVSDFCDRALWLDKGKVMEIGPSEQVVESYAKAQKEQARALRFQQRRSSTIFADYSAATEARQRSDPTAKKQLTLRLETSDRYAMTVTRMIEDHYGLFTDRGTLALTGGVDEDMMRTLVRLLVAPEEGADRRALERRIADYLVWADRDVYVSNQELKNLTVHGLEELSALCADLGVGLAIDVNLSPVTESLLGGYSRGVRQRGLGLNLHEFVRTRFHLGYDELLHRLDETQGLSAVNVHSVVRTDLSKTVFNDVDGLEPIEIPRIVRALRPEELEGIAKLNRVTDRSGQSMAVALLKMYPHPPTDIEFAEETIALLDEKVGDELSWVSKHEQFATKVPLMDPDHKITSEVRSSVGSGLERAALAAIASSLAAVDDDTEDTDAGEA